MHGTNWISYDMHVRGNVQGHFAHNRSNQSSTGMGDQACSHASNVRPRIGLVLGAVMEHVPRR
jgi:hypothetical protein